MLFDDNSLVFFFEDDSKEFEICRFRFNMVINDVNRFKRKIVELEVVSVVFLVSNMLEELIEDDEVLWDVLLIRILDVIKCDNEVRKLVELILWDVLLVRVLEVI